MKTTLLHSTSSFLRKCLFVFTLLGLIQTSAFAQSSNTALSFDGIDDYVSLGTNKFNNLKSVTFAAWIYRTGNNGSGYDEIIAKENIVSFSIDNSNNKLYLNFGNGTSWGAYAESSIDIPVNTWTHVAGTRDMNTGKIYVFINGAKVGEADNSLSGSNSNDACMGHRAGLSFENTAFEGTIDELRIWTKSLCGPEITAYSNGMVTASLPQLSASFSFEEGSAGGDNSTTSSVSDFMGNYSTTLNNFNLTGLVSNFVSGNASITGSVSAYPLTTPVITTAGGTSICSGSSLALYTTPASAYYWSNGQTTPVCNAVTTGSYNVTTYDINGCNATSPSIVLNSASSYTLTSAYYTAGTTSFCRGLSQTISVRVNYTPVGSKSFQLQLSRDSNFSTINYTVSSTLTGGMGTLTFASTAVRLWAAGKYYVRVTSSCITNGSLALTPITVWAPLSVQAISNSPVCSGDPLEMGATDGANSYSWSGPGGFSAPVQSAVLNSAGMLSGTYTVTAVNGCGTYSGSTTVVINALPTLEITTTNATCPGANNGSINMVSTDPHTPLTYAIDNQPTDIPSFNNLPAGSYEVEVINANGCKIEQFVTVSDLDETPPLAVAKDITIPLDADGNAVLEASAIDGGSSDACGIQSMMVEPAYFGIGQVGTNLVTLTLTDNNGNTSQASSIVTIEDITPPVLDAYSFIDVALGTEGTTSVSPSDLVINAYDVSGIASMELSRSTFDCSSVGDNTVLLAVTDNNGNTTSLPVTIHVTDNTAPSLSVNSITAFLNENGNVSVSPMDVNGGSTDACGIQSMTLSQTEFNCSNIGNNTVLFTVTDMHGNVSTADVNITIEDHSAPALNLKSNYNLVLDGNGMAILTATELDSLSSDNCSGALTFGLSKNDFTMSDLGYNTVVVTANDENGNSSMQEVSLLISDTTKPVVTTVENQTKVLSKSCAYMATGTEFDPVTIIDYNTEIDPTSQSITLSYELTGATTLTGYGSLHGKLFNQGTTKVTWMAVDASGNIGTSCFTVTVVDQTPPVVRTRNITIGLQSDGTASIAISDIDAGTNDNCTIQSLVLTPTAFDCSNAGDNIVTLTATDPAGNTASATAIVTISGTSFATTQPAIYINQANKVNWVNIPSVNNGSSSTIESAPSFNGNILTLAATGGNITSSSCTGLGVTGSGTSVTACGGADYMNQTVNKSQSIKATLTNSTLGITSLSFRSAYSGKVMVTGRRNGQAVITFSKYLTANVFDTFDFTTACALRGICTVDEVEFKLSDRTTGCVRRWNQYEDNENTDYEDGTNLNPNCGFTIQDMMLIVKQKDECNIGGISFNWDNGVFASKVVGVSENLSTGNSTVHSLGSNSDGIFTTGSPVSNNSAKRLVVGYNWLGLASAWEVTSQCKLRTIRQGLLSNSEVLPVGNALNLLMYQFKVTSVSANGQFIYGKRMRYSNGSIVDIRWRVNEYFQRAWVSNPQVIQFSKTGEIEIEDEDHMLMTEDAANGFGDLNVDIYPNPSNDVFRFKVESGSTEAFSIELFDMMGRTIKEYKDLNAEQEIAVGDDLKAGVYLVKVTQGSEVRFAKVTRLN